MKNECTSITSQALTTLASSLAAPCSHHAEQAGGNSGQAVRLFSPLGRAAVSALWAGFGAAHGIRCSTSFYYSEDLGEAAELNVVPMPRDLSSSQEMDFMVAAVYTREEGQVFGIVFGESNGAVNSMESASLVELLGSFTAQGAPAWGCLRRAGALPQSAALCH
jgi:hypothetical protein